MQNAIASGWDQESQAGACFVSPLYMENIPRKIVIYSMENYTYCTKTHQASDAEILTRYYCFTCYAGDRTHAAFEI